MRILILIIKYLELQATTRIMPSLMMNQRPYIMRIDSYTHRIADEGSEERMSIEFNDGNVFISGRPVFVSGVFCVIILCQLFTFAQYRA